MLIIITLILIIIGFLYLKPVKKSHSKNYKKPIDLTLLRNKIHAEKDIK